VRRAGGRPWQAVPFLPACGGVQAPARALTSSSGAGTMGPLQPCNMPLVCGTGCSGPPLTPSLLQSGTTCLRRHACLLEHPRSLPLSSHFLIAFTYAAPHPLPAHFTPRPLFSCAANSSCSHLRSTHNLRIIHRQLKLSHATFRLPVPLATFSCLLILYSLAAEYRLPPHAFTIRDWKERVFCTRPRFTFIRVRTRRGATA